MHRNVSFLLALCLSGLLYRSTKILYDDEPLSHAMPFVALGIVELVARSKLCS